MRQAGLLVTGRRKPGDAVDCSGRSPAAPRPFKMKDTGENVSELPHQRLVMLLVGLIALTIYTALYVFRSYDDNRLTSWQWAYGPNDVFWLLPTVAAGLAAAYLISGIKLPVRWRMPVLFLSAFTAAIPMWGMPEVIVDAARYFVQAKYVMLNGPGYLLQEWGGDIGAWSDLPLVPLLYGVAFTLFGETRIVAQALSTLLFAGTVVSTWLIGRILWDDKVGGTAAALLLAMPYLLTQPALMLVDVPTMFFLSLAVFATIKAVRNGGVAYLAAAPVTIVLAMLSKYSTWVMLSVLPVIILVLMRGNRRIALARGFKMALATVLFAGTLALLKFDVVSRQMSLLWSYQWPGLARWEESVVSTFLYQVHPFVTAAALCSAPIALAKRDSRYVIVAWMILLVLALGIKRARYVLITLPMLALMAGYALREIADGRLRRFIVAGSVASALITALAGYLPMLKATSAANLVAAAERLDAMEVDRVEVFALPQSRSIVNPAVLVPILDLYTAKQVLYRDGTLPPPSWPAIATSPLRFTWAFRIPSFYALGDGAPNDAVLVLASRPGQEPPAAVAGRLSAMSSQESFEKSDKLFKFKSFVYLYAPAR